MNPGKQDEIGAAVVLSLTTAWLVAYLFHTLARVR